MFPKELQNTLTVAWPLLMGLGLIMVGNGLQGTLLGVRATFEGFPVFATGLIMSLYYLGFLIGCLITPSLITSVGHIRVFAALASVASSTILLHGVFVDPWVWGCVRVFSGVSFAGLFIVAESWINDISTNKTRGKIFGLYFLVIHGGLFGGQFLLGLGSVEELDHFIMISILISVSLLPLTLANKPSPGYQEPETLSYKRLLVSSPVSLMGVCCSGFCSSIFFGLGPAYAAEMKMNESEIAIFMGAFVFGSGLIPLFVGWISDWLPRRRVIIGLAFSMIVLFLSAVITGWVFFLSFLIGGVIASLYSVSVAYMTDHMRPSQMLSASTSMLLANAVGASIGPLVVGTLMSLISISAFFIAGALVGAVLMSFGIYRENVSEALDVEDQGTFVPIPTRSATTAMHIIEDD